MDAEELIARYERYVNPGLARALRFMGLNAIEKTGHGAVVVTEDGEEYLDCAGGYGVFVQGYQNPQIVAKAHAQLDELAMSSRILLNRPMVDLAEELARITPGDLQYTFFCNSGTEAVEAALKFARIQTGRTRIIATYGAFHGKTMGSLSASGRDTYRRPFEPLVPDIIHVPYGDADAIAGIIDHNTAAVIVEPIQGEGGVIVPPDDYLPRIRKMCDQTGALFIADEVQTGIGRTGRMFAVEHSDVVPDYLCLAKALGGGIIPIGAVVGRPNAWTFFDSSPLIHTSTFGGNPLACAVAKEALRVTIEEELPQRAATLGSHFLSQLHALQNRYPQVITDVRGRGLMIGIEVPNAGVGGALISELFQRHILAVYTLNNEKVIRMIPPLVITRQQLDQVIEALAESLNTVQSILEDLLEE
ncbi:aspartate aminotransferase family protein [Sulfobacillus thermosulfidooxidans]|uniref:aspartate aminotransferase family protein n=1 Tax=Sulfobacillus thermosulfidooxidans TaxID=28034 RepID=UPI0006B60C04|nr:aspartate aminotransferase family protein [Sulfobacillus thermosulfidooxidans]